MKTMWERALDYLYYELKKARIALGHAEWKPNVNHQELDDLRGKLDILEYLCGLVIKEDVE